MVAQGGCNTTSIDDYLRAPWAYDFPLRFRITRAKVTTPHDATGPTHLWAALPIHRAIDRPPVWTPALFGLRVIDLPELACLAATWREAMDYALTGAAPTPLAEVYPAWCGLDAAASQRLADSLSAGQPARSDDGTRR